MMANYELKNIDPEDIGDLLEKVEISFDIKFVGDELKNVMTFGQLCDHIVDKIQLENSDDCTSQQAFYKLRDAISSLFQIDGKTISPDIALADLLTRQNRRSLTKKLEKHLGFKLNILRPPYWLTGILTFILLGSLIGPIFDWQIGLLGLVLSAGGFWVANKIGNELDLETIGQVVEKMIRENYLKSRRDPKTFNKNEVEKILADLFSHELDLNKNNLKREAKFV